MTPANRRPRFEPLQSATPPFGAQNADHSLEQVVRFSMSPPVQFRMSFDEQGAGSRLGRDDRGVGDHRDCAQHNRSGFARLRRAGAAAGTGSPQGGRRAAAQRAGCDTARGFEAACRAGHPRRSSSPVDVGIKESRQARRRACRNGPQGQPRQRAQIARRNRLLAAGQPEGG